MDTIALSLFSLFFFFIKPTTSNTCAPSSCHPAGPQVRFPFYLSNRQLLRCGLPGYNLFCNNENQTILNLPSGEVIVRRISYAEQSVIIDPQFCLHNRINDFSLVGTPFLDFFLYSYTFFNCSSDFLGAPRYAPVSPVTFNCLSGPNYSVVAMPSYYGGDAIMPASCRNISTIAIPIRRYQELGGDGEELELRWFMRGCSSCEFNGGTCGASAADPLEVICYQGHARGLPRSAKYGIIFGLGAPSLLCIFALIYFTKKKAQAQAQSQSQNQSLQHRGIDLSSITITPRPTLLMGLDGPTIESYPKTILGESKRLPKPNDGTCPICLSDYEPKDELRTIPECNHYFHAGCIDEWLRLNATCPLCRNMPESSVVTPCTSTSSSAATSSNPTTSS